MFDNVFACLGEPLTQAGFTRKRFEELQAGTRLIASLTSRRVDRWDGMKLANKLLELRDVALELYSVAASLEKDTYTERKRQGSIAYLERSTFYFKERSIKPTEMGKEAYKRLDRQYVECAKKEAAAHGLTLYLKGKVTQFQDAYYMIKQIYTADNETKGTML